MRSTPVTFTKGGETVSGTTNAFGQVTVTFPDNGDWTYTVGVAAGTEGDYTGLTGTVHVVCGDRNAQTIAMGCKFPAVLSYQGSVAQAQSAFYFNNVAGPYAGGPYTLTWQSRPAAIPKELQLLYFAFPFGAHDPYYITMPDEAWFSPPIPATAYGYDIDVYFYAWRSGPCQFSVMVIDDPYPLGAYGTGTRGAGNNVKSYNLHACEPFQMGETLLPPYRVTGTHGGGDRTGPNDGTYTNARIGLTYTVNLTVRNVTTGVTTFSGTVGHDLSAVLSFGIAAGGGRYTPPSSSWSSSDTGVFTVTPSADGSSAVVHPVAPGSAVVSVTVTDPDCTSPTLNYPLTIT